MPHAALCVLGRTEVAEAAKDVLGFNAARGIVCVGTPDNKEVFLMKRRFQCRTQHCVCWDTTRTTVHFNANGFQCRTQHCVCWDSVSRSPCPAWAEKAFWKDALFCAVFGAFG